MSPDQVLAIVLASISAWTLVRIFRGPIGGALARRIGGSAPARPALDDAQVADLQARVAELEERLDFTERVLLQERQAGQLREGDGT
jgi:hypothetical protein